METIEEIDKQIAKLRERRKELVRQMEKERRNALDVWMLELLAIIGENPGIDNTGIWKKYDLDPRDYNNTLTSLRRRGLIINKGTRKHPMYFVKE